MPGYLLNANLWIALYPIPLMAGLISLLLAYLSSGRSDDFWRTFSIVFAISILGITAGQIMGQSREPAVTAVMPAILTMIAGILGYIVSAKTAQQQMLAAIIVIGFTVNLLVGTFWGAQLRYEFESGQKMLLRGEAISQNIKLERLKYEKQLEEVRNFLKLPKEAKSSDCGVCVCPNDADSTNPKT